MVFSDHPTNPELLIEPEVHSGSMPIYLTFSAEKEHYNATDAYNVAPRAAPKGRGGNNPQSANKQVEAMVATLRTHAGETGRHVPGNGPAGNHDRIIDKCSHLQKVACEHGATQQVATSGNATPHHVEPKRSGSWLWALVPRVPGCEAQDA